MGLQIVQKQVKDDDTRRLYYYRKIMVKKEWKTTLHLMHIRQQMFSSLPVFLHHDISVGV